MYTKSCDNWEKYSTQRRLDELTLIDGIELTLNNNQLFCTEQDSKELSPRSLDKMLLEQQVKSQHVQTCLNLFGSI